MNRQVYQAIIDTQRESTGLDLHGAEMTRVSGGCINETFCLRSRKANLPRIFVKVNRAAALPMFEAEAAGLLALARSGVIRVPAVYCSGVAGGSAYLCIEHIVLSPRVDAVSQRKLGECLAQLHQVLSPNGHFGWQQNNTIGETPQINDWSADWAAFFARHRLGYQFDLAACNGWKFLGAAQLLAAVPDILADHHPQASLLHGDLWSGNVSFDPDGNPVLFDPAVYYGDRETDLAFTDLFGGFSPEFYAGYHEVWPLVSGSEHRKLLYNLYHILNHYNLFGGCYAQQAEEVIERLNS